VSPSLLDESGKTTPASAWGMCHNRMRSIVKTSVALFVPWIDTIEIEVTSIGLDV
jgi:hypothetical protein